MKRCTDITIILDKSGSMFNCHGATIEMLNKFIDDRRNDKDECLLSLFQFSSHVKDGDPLTRTFSGLPVQDAPRITSRNYILHGSTALYDAVGYTIDDVGRRLSAMAEHDRPDRVLIVVMTDGFENDSKKYPTGPVGQRMLTEKVNHQRDVYKWEFVYLGADMTSQEAEAQSTTIGIYANNTLNYNKGSTRKMSDTLSKSVGNYAGIYGAAGPQGPQGPGIFAFDAETQTTSAELRAEANKTHGGGSADVINKLTSTMATSSSSRPRSSHKKGRK